jgi:hypothetical protein
MAPDRRVDRPFGIGVSRTAPPADPWMRHVWPQLAWGSLGVGWFWGPYGTGQLPWVVPPQAPIEAPLGGLQLDVDPRRAEVYVDGTRVGRVEEFSGYYKHLPLAAGSHVIQIFAPGHEPLIFDVIITPGRTSTYRYSLPRAPGG